MAFSVKDWRNAPDTSTPLSAAAMEDLETRISDYIDAQVATRLAATIVDAKGDLLVGTAADTLARLAVGGTNGHVLTVDSTQGSGVKWAAGASSNDPRLAVVRKASDETVSNSTTLQNDDHLALTVAASEVWEVRLTLLLSAAGTAADWKFAFSVPTAATFNWAPLSHQNAAEIQFGGLLVTTTPGGLITTGTYTHGSMSGAHGVVLHGVYVGGANAGTLQFRWAQNTAIVADSKVLTNSCLIATKLN